MIKQSKSGEIQKHHESRDLDNFLGEKFETVGTEHKWVGQELEVNSDPLIDYGKGKPLIMRFFEFKLSPDMIKKAKPTNQELFNAHAQQIKNFLFRDGLIAFEGVEPKIIWEKKKKGFRIMVVCEPRHGISILEKPQTLQELIKPNATRNTN